MMRFLLSAMVLIFFQQYSYAQANAPMITAVYDSEFHFINLEWKMLAINRKTAFIILKSIDGIHWKEFIRDREYRMYNNDDSYSYKEERVKSGKNFYRLRIIDEYKNTIAFSSPVSAGNEKIVETSLLPVTKEIKPINKESVPIVAKKQKDPNNSWASIHSASSNEKNTWVIYPNPVGELLRIKYESSSPITGAINVTVLDISGKMQKRFRCASTCKLIEIPVDGLLRGIYVVQIFVSNEILMNQRFVKQ